MSREDTDWQYEYERLKESDPEFRDVVEKLADVVAEERPEDGEIYNSDYRAFVTGYREVKKTFFSKTDPRTVERTRRGDTDAAAELLVQMGIVGKRGFED